MSHIPEQRYRAKLHVIIWAYVDIKGPVLVHQAGRYQLSLVLPQE